MRRMSAVRAARGGQVAIYDALLFLMVVVLVSVGMFLYSAKLTSEGAGFHGGTYELVARDQLDAALGLPVDVAGLYVNVTGGPSPRAELLVDSGVVYRGPWTVDKVLHGCVQLAGAAREEGATRDLGGVGPRVDAVFRRAALEGTRYAWELELGGNVTFFFSDSDGVEDPDDLPPVRYAATFDLTMDQAAGSLHAELRYFLWLA